MFPLKVLFISFSKNTPVKEPIDPLIRDKIVELSWKFGENALPKEIKELLDHYVCEMFKGEFRALFF